MDSNGAGTVFASAKLKLEYYQRYGKPFVSGPLWRAKWKSATKSQFPTKPVCCHPSDLRVPVATGTGVDVESTQVY